MPDAHPQTVRHRRVSAELKRMRDEANKNAYEVADAMGWNRTKVHRIERGEWKRLREADIRRLADLYDVGDSERVDALVSMARQASTTGWWARYSDVLGPGSYVSLEAGASHLRFYSGLLIPGLLQTRNYTEAVFRGGGITSKTELTRRLEARKARQAIVDNADGPRIEAVIDQAALNKVVGRPTAMAEQLIHLIELNKQGRAEIRVIPDSAGSHAAMTGQFVILNFPTDHENPVVFIDSAHNGLFLEDNRETSNYSIIYDNVYNGALDIPESNELLGIYANNLIK